MLKPRLQLYTPRLLTYAHGPCHHEVLTVVRGWERPCGQALACVEQQRRHLAWRLRLLLLEEEAAVQQ